MRFYEMALSHSPKKKGEVPFRKSAIADQQIKKVIAEISNRTGVPEAEIENQLERHHRIIDIKELAKYSMPLFRTMLDNAVEGAAFDRIGKSDKFKDIKFNVKIFNKLLEYVQEENEGMFPLTSPGKYRKIYDLNTILVPNPNYGKRFNSVGTAAADSRGNFIFNVPFMENLLNYANVIGLQVNQPKYQSQGGDIPDIYGYIEFLILHEILHYRYDDLAIAKRYKRYPHVAHNWASDLRSNYLLVKSGYPQLPMGLYSDDLNFDREETNTYTKLIARVHEEMMKVPPEMRRWLDKFDTDTHMKKKKKKEKPNPDKSPQIFPGDIVLSKSDGTYSRVVEINDDGTVETIPASAEDVANAKRKKTL